MNKEIMNINMFHVEIQKEDLVIYGDRGGAKHYEIHIKLDENYKATSISKACMYRLKQIIKDARDSIIEVNNSIKNWI